jgi:hypothetical protein
LNLYGYSEEKHEMCRKVRLQRKSEMVLPTELLLALLFLLLFDCCPVSGCSRNLTVVFCSQWQFGHISPMLPAGDICCEHFESLL